MKTTTVAIALMLFANSAFAEIEWQKRINENQHKFTVESSMSIEEAAQALQENMTICFQEENSRQPSGFIPMRLTIKKEGRIILVPMFKNSWVIEIVENGKGSTVTTHVHSQRVGVVQNQLWNNSKLIAHWLDGNYGCNP